MRRTFFLAALLISFLLSPINAQARELSAADQQAAQDAFLFVDRGGWNDALLHAKRASNPLLYKIVQFLFFRSRDSGADFEAISRFADDNDDWPDQKLLVQRA